MQAPAEAANLVALNYAGATLVTPLGGVGVVCTQIAAARWLGDTLKWYNAVGTAVVLAGCTLITLGAASAPVVTTLAELSYALSGPFTPFLINAILLLLFLQYSNTLLALCVMLSVLSMMCVLSARAASSMVFTLSFASTLHERWLYALSVEMMIATAALQIFLLQRALRLYEVSKITPLSFGCTQLMMTAGATLLYSELHSANLPMFCVGVVLDVIGCALVSYRRPQSDTVPPHRITQECSKELQTGFV